MDKSTLKAIVNSLTSDQINTCLKLLHGVDLDKTFLQLEPHDAQAAFMMSDANETLFFGANQIGKTECVLALCLMFATGEYPEWFPANLKMPVPNRGRLCGPDLKNWVLEIVEPKLKRMLPKRFLKPGREGWVHNPQTKSLDQLVFANGSVIDIMSYQQDQISFESWTGNWAVFDEPPPRDMYIATVRGLAALNGRTYLSLTPLTQPWIFQLVDACKDFQKFGCKGYREGIRQIQLGDGKNYQTKIRVVHAKAEDNLVKVNWRGKLTGGLTPEGLAFFKSTLKAEEIGARIEGEFVHLQGLIYKELDEAVHVIDDDTVPAIGTVYCILDPHDAKPHAVVWVKVDAFGNARCVASRLIQGNLKSLVENILQTEEELQLTVAVRLIDPNKGKTPTAVSGQTWQEELNELGLWFDFDVNNDIPLGHQKVRGLLFYDVTQPLDEINHPRLYFCRHGAAELIFSMRNYVYKQNTNKDKNNVRKEEPEEKYKDLPDCLRYGAMYGFEYFEPMNTMGDFYNPSDFKTSTVRK